jgi:hypothetical protein
MTSPSLPAEIKGKPGVKLYNIQVMNNEPQNPNPGDEPDYDKPVAYDNQGRPLYAHPPAQAQAAPQAASQPQPTLQQPQQSTHQYVHISRPMEPADLEISPDIKRRHDESARRYPRLNLSKGEFIISAVKRHPIGLVEIWGIAVIIVAALAAMLAFFMTDSPNSNDLVALGAAGLGLMSFFIMIGAILATYVYNNNRFFLTNESVIQEIQNSIFSKHEQTVSLANIEDASYRQDGILPHLLNYGTIRLSTEGDETTYRFSYVANPKQHIAVLNNAVEAFKNGRPVFPTDDQPS